MKSFVAAPASSEGFRLVEIPDPQPGPSIVVVDVAAASLNRGEVLHIRKYHSIRDGGAVGWDFAGTVVEAATDGVGPAVGTRVFGWSPQRGTWSQRLAVKCEHLTTAPDGLSLVQASTLGVAGLTALAALRMCPRSLDTATVAVTGASGGVGLFATQIASHEGARTIAIVRPQTHPERVDVLNRWCTHVADSFDQLPPSDLIVESVGGQSLSQSLVAIADGGTVVTLGRTDDQPAEVPPGWFQRSATLTGLTFARAYARPGSTSTALDQLANLVVDGAMSVEIGLEIPAAQLLDGIEAVVERSTLGKVVVTW